MLLAGNNLLLPSSAVSPGLKFLLIVLAPFAGPTLAAFGVTAALEDRAGVSPLLGRYVQWRFGLPWYLIALIGPLVLLMLAVAALYGTAALPPVREQGIAIGAAYLITLVVNLFIGGILGSIVLSVFWSLWHLPLILTPGGTTWTGSIVLYIMLNVALTVVHTWVFNGTRSSLLSVMLLHAAINTSARLILPNVPGLSRDEGNLLLVVVYGLVALLLVMLTKGRLAAPSRNGTARSTRTE
jgi:hypothetical protein